MSLVKSSAVFAGFTLISRLSGFVRDVMMANLIGASWLSDAFFVAFKLPNFFRRLFAEGAFNVAFIPSFSGILTSEGREAAIRFASEVMSVLLVVLLVLNAIFILFMPWVMPLFAPGFADTPEKFDLTVTLSQITFPYILFISLVSLLGGVLNSFGKFAAPAASPILLNLCMIGGMAWLTTTPTPAHALAWSVLLAGIAQLAWLVAICWRHDMLPSLLIPRITPQVRTMLLLMAPAAMGSGVQQLNLLIDVVIASHIPDAVSYLYYADRITELPIGVIGVAVGTVLLPTLSKHIKAGEITAAHHSMNRALELVLLFGLPATAGCLVAAEPIIRVLYMHGQFTAENMVATSHALMAFGLGLPAFLAVKVFAPGFYANHDTKTPFKIALLCVAVNLCLNLALMGPLRHVGMALATTIASWVNLGMMVAILHRRGMFVPDATLKLRLKKMLLATKIMTLATYLASLALAPFFMDAMGMRSLALLGLIGGAGVVYGTCILSFRAYDVALMQRLFARRGKKKAR